MTAQPLKHNIDESVSLLCQTAVKAMVANVPDATPEERQRMLLGLQYPTDEIKQHMDEFEGYVIEVLEAGALMAANGLNGTGYVVGDTEDVD